MEWLYSLVEGEAAPALTAFVLGLLTALSPCPLATNIAAIGFVGRHMESRRALFRSGLLYTLGRIVAYAGLGAVLIILLRRGADLLGIRTLVARYGEMAIGPVLLVVGLFMLFGRRLRLPSFGFRDGGERLARRGGWGALCLGLLFALAFCPTSGVFYFGVLIPLSAATDAGYLLPVLFALATALPVLAAAWTLAFAAHRIGRTYGRMQAVQRALNRVVGLLFLAVGLVLSIALVV